MSTAETGSAKSGLGWWPKLVLWTLVLVFGALYLGSVKRNSAVDAPVPATQETKGAAVEVAPPAPFPASPAEHQAVAAAAVGPTGGAESAGAEPQKAPSKPSKEPEPVRAAESAAFADSLLNKPHSDEDREGSAEAAEPPLAEGKAELPPPSEAASAAAAEPPTPAQSGGASPQPPAEQKAPPSESQAAERARVIMEYEAMRRAAEEHMRRSWGQMRMPAPGGAPYARPGYGYGPGVYPAR